MCIDKGMMNEYSKFLGKREITDMTSTTEITQGRDNDAMQPLP